MSCCHVCLCDVVDTEDCEHKHYGEFLYHSAQTLSSARSTGAREVEKTNFIQKAEIALSAVSKKLHCTTSTKKKLFIII